MAGDRLALQVRQDRLVELDLPMLLARRGLPDFPALLGQLGLLDPGGAPGPTGAVGATGPQGPQGPEGRAMLSGPQVRPALAAVSA